MVLNVDEKACHATIDSDPQEYQITFSQFCEDPLPGHTFTFWDWFYAAMELTRDHLHELSAKNLIIGFISRHRTEQMLLKCKPGTFLLRFSNSILGKLFGQSMYKFIMLRGIVPNFINEIFLFFYAHVLGGISIAWVKETVDRSIRCEVLFHTCSGDTIQIH